MTRIAVFLPEYATSVEHVPRLDIASIPGDRITDLIYCFAGFDAQGSSFLPTWPNPHDAESGPRHNTGQLALFEGAVSGAQHRHEHRRLVQFLSARVESRALFFRGRLDASVAPDVRPAMPGHVHHAAIPYYRHAVHRHRHRLGISEDTGGCRKHRLAAPGVPFAARRRSVDAFAPDDAFGLLRLRRPQGGPHNV
jgi:hypothetical protein